MSNWKLVEGVKRLYHKRKEYHLIIPYRPGVDNCRTGTGKYTPAFTSAAERRESMTPSIIVLCDAYLKSVFGSKYRPTGNLEVGWLQRMRDLPKFRIDYKNAPPTEFDQKAGFHGVLLNHLTHTRTSKIDDPLNEQGFDTRDVTNPFWEACVKEKHPGNAQSIAYFAIALLWSKRGHYVYPEGEIIDLSWTEWQYHFQTLHMSLDSLWNT